MRYKVVDYIENEREAVQTGTCELCFGSDIQNNDVLVVEDGNGKRIEVVLHEWDWGDLENYYIDNVVAFSDWLSKQDVDCELDGYGVLNLIDLYYEEKEAC